MTVFGRGKVGCLGRAPLARLLCFMPEAPDATPAPSATRRVVLLLVKILVSAGLLWLLLGRTDTSQLWSHFRNASILWLLTALALYLAMIIVSAWRWHLLLAAQGIIARRGWLISSYLVATFFNNFLPSNIGGDVIRIRDTSPQAGSKTLATTVILMDRGIGLLGLFLVAAVGATMDTLGGHPPVWASVLWAAFLVGVLAAGMAIMKPGVIARLLSPLRMIHQEWVEERINRLTGALARFRGEPMALLSCFAGAIAVQVILVLFYFAVGRSMGIDVPVWHLAVIVPVSFVVQMVPVSLNGLGVREATFKIYFAQIGLPIEAALAVSLMGAALVMIFSVSGAVANLTRGTAAALPTEP